MKVCKSGSVEDAFLAGAGTRIGCEGGSEIVCKTNQKVCCERGADAGQKCFGRRPRMRQWPPHTPVDGMGYYARLQRSYVPTRQVEPTLMVCVVQNKSTYLHSLQAKFLLEQRSSSHGKCG